MHAHLVITALAAALAAVSAQAQSSNVKPPQAQAWIDVATYSGMGMPAMDGGAANPMQALGNLFGGAGAAKNTFGHTLDGATGRWVDVTLMTRANPSLAEATQAVPAGFLSPALKLQAPPGAKPLPREDGDEVLEPDVQRPKGRLLMYWGCGASVRPGQPKVLDMATATPADIAKFFVSRRATTRGAHSATGRPVWPSAADPRMVPERASLVGEHAFSGSGVPESFRFAIPAAQDLMPPLQLQQTEQGGATQLAWNAVPAARAYFVVGMGATRQDEMVIWTSSEVPDAGFGLVDYQPNAAIDRWLKEKVLLAPAATSCTVPKGVFPGEGAMLRAIAYGNELNLAHPPRPADPKAPWEPEWAAKVRVKSVTTAMLGMPTMDRPPQTSGQEPAPQPGDEAKKEEKKLKPVDLLKGILGR